MLVSDTQVGPGFSTEIYNTAGNFFGMEAEEFGIEASSPSLDGSNCGTIYIISNQSSSCSSSSSVVV